MKVAVLGGGISTERDVSLRSAKAVSDALTKAGFEVINIDPVDYAALDTIGSDCIVFPVLHGANGEDGKIQVELEKRNLPFLGSKSRCSEICFNKALAKIEFRKSGIPIADGDVVSKDNYSISRFHDRPHVLKVCEGGSSIGTYIVRDPTNIDESKVNEVFSLDDEALEEELIEGIEITIPVLDGRALPVIEIRPPAEQDFDYKNKYNGETKEICPAVSISRETQELAQDYAQQIHKTLGCRHLSRSDMIVRPDGNIVVLEVNTMPGMTDQSLFPKSALAYGLSFPELVTEFVNMVKRDYNIA